MRMKKKERSKEIEHAVPDRSFGHPSHETTVLGTKRTKGLAGFFFGAPSERNQRTLRSEHPIRVVSGLYMEIKSSKSAQNR